MTIYFGFAVADSMLSEATLIKREKLTPEDVQRIISVGVQPCLNPSHKPTIEAMRQKFGFDVDIPAVPPKVSLKAGDALVVMGIRGLPRLTDRHEYTAEEVGSASFDFSLYTILG